MTRSEFRPDINGLRGLSVALVVAYHLQWRGAGGGFIGVDVFFVISGYLMTRIIWSGLEDGRFGYWRFMVARAARIWPALAALVLLLLLSGALWLPPFDLEIVAEQARAALLFWSNHFFLARSGYNTQAADTNWLLHTWSLSVEWQFYMLYPLLLMAVFALARRWATAVLLLGIALSCAYQAWLGGSDASFFLLPARAWELLAGGVAYLASRGAQEGPSKRRAWAGYAGVALVLGSALAIALLKLRPVGLGLLMWPAVAGTMLVLWANRQDNVLLRPVWLQRLGLWSYSVYLWHWPIIVGLRMTEFPVAHPWLTSALTAVASVLLGALSYRWVEHLARHRGAWRAAVKPALAMSLAGIGTLVVAASQGLHFRQPQESFRSYRASTVPLYFPASCDNFKKPPQALRVCAIDKGSARRVLVIGDSHAEHFYAWFTQHSGVSVDFFTAPECPPVPHFERLQPGYRCLDYAALAWEKALSPVYDTVVVSARWSTLVAPPYCHQPAGERCGFIDGPARQERVLRELRGAIERALNAGKTVVVAEGSPEARFRVPERLARERFWYGEPRLEAQLAPLVAQLAWIDPLFRELQARPGFHVVSLRDRMCNGNRCRLYDAELQRPIYQDDSHYDPVWIAKQADLFARFVRRPS